MAPGPLRSRSRRRRPRRPRRRRAVRIRIREQLPPQTEGVELVAVTVAVPAGMPAQPVVDGAGAVADAVVELSDAVATSSQMRLHPNAEHAAGPRASLVRHPSTSVSCRLHHRSDFVGPDAVTIKVGVAIAATDTKGVELVAVTVAVACWDAGAATVVDGARSVANAAVVVGTDAVVHVVADAVCIEVYRAIAATRRGRRAGCRRSRSRLLDTGATVVDAGPLQMPQSS